MIRLGRLFGVEIRLHLSFILLPLFFGFYYGWQYGTDTGIKMSVLVLLVFVIVVGHELSHCWAASRFGIHTPHITLYPMGGVATMQAIPREPVKEMLISIAGPLFNFVLAAALYFPLASYLGSEMLWNPSLDRWEGVWAYLFWVNPVLGLFNLIPAFPMDGGRVFRAFLAFWLPYKIATRFSVVVGQFFAIIFFLFGIYDKQWMLCLVGVYVFFAGRAEMRQQINEQ